MQKNIQRMFIFILMSITCNWAGTPLQTEQEQIRHEIWHTIFGLRQYMHENYGTNKLPSKDSIRQITYYSAASIVAEEPYLLRGECSYIHAEQHGGYPLRSNDITIQELRTVYTHPYSARSMYANLSPMRTINANYAYNTRRRKSKIKQLLPHARRRISDDIKMQYQEFLKANRYH